MEKRFPLEVLTPERQFFAGEVEAVTVHAPDGELTVLAHHAPLVTVLATGAFRIKENGTWREAFHSEGFLEVMNDGHTVLYAQACEWPEEIDIARVEESKRREQIKLREAHTEAERRAIHGAIERAVVRMHIKEKR